MTSATGESAAGAVRRAPKALVFDMDGLLLDTERIARDTFVEACRAAGWSSPDMAVYARCIGVSGRDGGAILCAGYGRDFPWETVRTAWAARYLDHVENRPVDVKPGAVELLAYCRAEHIPCALATSTHERLATRKLALAGMADCFPIRVTGDMVRRGKPDPEPFLTAAERLGALPGQCWALEDSTNGVRSAWAAGFWVFQVPDLVEPPPELRRLGHTVVGALYDVLEVLRRARNGT